MSSSGVNSAAVPRLVIEFRAPSPLPVAEPLQGLEPGQTSLSPAPSSSLPHLTTGASPVDLQKIEKFQKIQEYATDSKQEIGFFGWKYFRAKRLAKEYLTEHGVDLKQILPKMPWNASRSLCVLCLLVEKGLDADQIHNLFANKEQVEQGQIDVRLGFWVDAASLDVLAGCQTSTFLKQVAHEAVVAATLQKIRDAGFSQSDGSKLIAIADANTQEPRVFAAAVLGLHLRVRNCRVEDLLSFIARAEVGQAPDVQEAVMVIIRVVLQEGDAAQKEAAARKLLALPLAELAQSRNADLARSVIGALSSTVTSCDAAQKEAAARELLALPLAELAQSRNADLVSSVISALSNTVAFCNDVQMEAAAGRLLALPLEDLVQSPNADLVHSVFEVLYGILVYCKNAEKEAAAHRLLALPLAELVQRHRNMSVHQSVDNALDSIGTYFNQETPVGAAARQLIARLPPLPPPPTTTAMTGTTNTPTE